MRTPKKVTRSPNLVDKRAEFKRAVTEPGKRYEAGLRMEENAKKMDPKARANIDTERNRKNRKAAFSDKRRGGL